MEPRGRERQRREGPRGVRFWGEKRIKRPTTLFSQSREPATLRRQQSNKCQANRDPCGRLWNGGNFKEAATQCNLHCAQAAKAKGREIA